MRVYKKNLPDGVKSVFALDKGRKVKLINKKMFDAKKKKQASK